MQSLNKLIELDMLKVPDFQMDFFQQEVLNNLHLEFFFENSRVIITPDFRYLTTGDANDAETTLLGTILGENQDVLTKVKNYLIYNLSVYSALLETNSFYLTLNKYVLISRFIMLEEEQNRFEIKLYTINKDELPKNYKDKIYLGRDFISLKTLRRDHFGLRFVKNSLKEQITKLRGRIADQVSETDRFELEQEYLKDTGDIINEFDIAAESIIKDFPRDLSSQEVEHSTLIEANRRFREVKHILIELEQSLSDIEAKMYQKELIRPVRYVTKFKKDVTNDKNYLMLKVNGRISDYVNGIQI